MARPRKSRTQAPEQSAAPVEPDQAPPVPAADTHPGGTPLPSLHDEPAAAEGEDAAPPQGRPSLVVRARHPIGRRRAGRSFGAGEVTIPLDALSEADREAIESDPMLIVRCVV